MPMGGETVTIVINTALLILAATVIYQSGKLAQRVDHLESWRAEVRDDLKAIRSVVDTIAAAFKHEVR